MSFEILKIIALLCNVGGSAATEWNTKRQLECQVYYIDCMEGAPITKATILSTCIKNRQQKFK